jgi:hypothetical protein
MADGASVKEYLLAVAKLWLRAIAGPAMACVALALLIVGLARGFDPKTTYICAIATLVVEILLFWPAQFKAWEEERRKAIAEKERNEAPDIRGRVKDAYLDSWLGRQDSIGEHEDKGSILDSFLTMRLEVTNYSQQVEPFIAEYRCEVRTSAHVYHGKCASGGSATLGVLLERMRTGLAPHEIMLRSEVEQIALPNIVSLNDSRLEKLAARENWIRFEFPTLPEQDIKEGTILVSVVTRQNVEFKLMECAHPWPRTGLRVVPKPEGF